MRKLLALAALLLASTTAQAQYTFRYGGKTILIDPDHGVVSIPGVYDNSGRPSRHTGKRHEAPEDDKVERPAPPAEALATPAPQPDTPAPQPPAAPAAPGATSPAGSSSPAAPANNMTAEPQPSSAPPPPAAPAQDTTQKSAPPPAVAAVPPPAAPTASPAAPAAVSDPRSPIGVWLTQEKEGKVRIEPCGTNLCGYSVDAKSSEKGEQVLIDMKPGKNMKWSGRIFDPKTGSTYDSSIALRGADTLRVQGCAFGGMFCGGQTWHRVD